MFGSIWNACKRLAVSINTTADLFDQANDRLRSQLGLDLIEETEETPLIEGTSETRLEKYTKGNGRTKAAK